MIKVIFGAIVIAFGCSAMFYSMYKMFGEIILDFIHRKDENELYSSVAYSYHGEITDKVIEDIEKVKKDLEKSQELLCGFKRATKESKFITDRKYGLAVKCRDFSESYSRMYCMENWDTHFVKIEIDDEVINLIKNKLELRVQTDEEKLAKLRMGNIYEEI